MTPCPLCFLKRYGGEHFEHLSDSPHTQDDWAWLGEHQNDPEVKQMLLGSVAPPPNAETPGVDA